MKKSKILAPALALTIFSTAAAVTGTVAWYFAQRAVSIKANVTSFNPEAGLKVTLHDGIGAKAVADHESTSLANQPAQIEHELIRDGSVDLANEKAYGAKYGRANNGIPSAFKEIDAVAHAADLLAGTTEDDQSTQDVDESKPYYYATKYTAEFELTKQNTGIEYALYYDNLGLEVGNSASSIQEALRIGFVTHEIIEDDQNTPDVDESDVVVDNYFVVAPFRASSDNYDNNVDDDGQIGQFVKSTVAADPRGNYNDVDADPDVTDNRIIFGYETTLTAQTTTVHNPDTDQDEEVAVLDEYGNPKYDAEVTSLASALEDNLNGLDGNVQRGHEDELLGYLGNLKNDATIEVTVYTWFEGEDPHSASNYVDGNPIETSLKFSLFEVED